MGSKYPILKPFEIIRVLESFGFVYRSQKGSHAKYVQSNLNQNITVIIPMHDEIAKGTLKNPPAEAEGFTSTHSALSLSVRIQRAV